MKIVRNGVPLYYQAEHYIREKIASNEWEIGSQIPTELQLIELFGISRATLRQAIANLVNEGLLEKLQGKGTFVRKMKVYATDIGINPEPNETITHKIISFTKQRDLAKECSLLQLPPDEEFAVFTYLHCPVQDSNVLYNLSVTYMPVSRYPDIEQHFFKSTVYNISKSIYNISLAYTMADISAVRLREEYAAHLRVKADTPTVKIDKVYYDFEDKPVFFTVMYSHPFFGKVQIKKPL